MEEKKKINRAKTNATEFRIVVRRQKPFAFVVVIVVAAAVASIC